MVDVFSLNAEMLRCQCVANITDFAVKRVLYLEVSTAVCSDIRFAPGKFTDPDLNLLYI